MYFHFNRDQLSLFSASCFIFRLYEHVMIHVLTLDCHLSPLPPFNFLNFLLIGSLSQTEGPNSCWCGGWCSLAGLRAWDDWIKDICSHWHHTEPNAEKSIWHSFFSVVWRVRLLKTLFLFNTSIHRWTKKIIKCMAKQTGTYIAPLYSIWVHKGLSTTLQ